MNFVTGFWGYNWCLLLSLVSAALATPISLPNVNIGESTACTNLAPSFDRIHLGVDITLFDFSPANSRQEFGFRQPIFDFSCTSDRTWDYNNGNGTIIKYQLPEQIASANTVPRPLYNYDAHNFDSYQQYRTALSDARKIDDDSSSGAFVRSESYLTVQTAQLQAKSYYSFAQTVAPSIISQTVPYWGLNMSRYLNEYIENELPDEYETNPNVYNNLIATYGTHYISQAELGGIFSIRYTYSDLYKSIAGDGKLSTNIQKDFLLQLFQHGGPNATDQPEKDFVTQQTSPNRLVYYGGQGSFITDNNFRAWWDSVANAPWLVNVQLQPLWLLVRGNCTAQKQDSLKRAIVSYIDNAYLVDLRNGLSDFITRNLRGQQAAQQILKNIDAFLKSGTGTTLNHTQVRLLGENVTNFLNPLIPFDKFQSATSMQIKVDWDNKFPATLYNNVEIDEPCGQTFMQFSVQFPNSATPTSLLDAVSLKYTYYLDTHPQTTNVTTAKNGEFTDRLNHCRTPVYDDSGNIIQQSVSWSLQMPLTSPGYLQNVRLCVYTEYVGSVSVNATQTKFLSCAYPNEETNAVPIPYIWQGRETAFKWVFSFMFGDMGPF